MPAVIPILPSIADLADTSDAWIVDIWGVMHNGARAHPAAARACSEFRARGGTVVLLSNAPRPFSAVVPHMAALGVPSEAYDAGVKILCGSESGFSLTPYGHWHARELELFVKYLGLSPLEAITCSTANGAFALRLEGRIGTVEPGRLADVIVVDGDPTADIRILSDRSRLRHVISRGVPVELAGPWPERRPLPGERVGMWSAQPLTWDVVHP